MPPTAPPWARLGSLFVTPHHAEDAVRRGAAVSVYPDGLEAMSYIPSAFPTERTSMSSMGSRESYVGTLPSAGVVDMDTNPILTPSKLRGDSSSVGLYSQMTLEDPVARAIVYAWTLPIVRSAWTIEPNGEDRAALEVAEFVRANFWEYVRGGFQSFIEQAVAAVWQGFSLFEIVAAFDRDLGKVRLDQLSPMLPRTVYEWGRYDDGRWGVIQEGYTGDPDVGRTTAALGSQTSFSPDKLLHFAWAPEGDNPEGRSILRPCYGAWKARRLYLKLEASGYERGAYGIPFVTVSPTARAGDSAMVNEILRELRTGSRAWATFPPGYDLKFADFPMKGADVREARRAAGMDMARAALAPFLFTGEPGAGGAYALVKGHQDFFQMALQSAAEMISGVLSAGPHALIKRLVSWNFPNVEAFPYLAPGSISIGDPSALVLAVKAAAEAGVILPDKGIEEAIRSALGLPEMVEQTSEEWRHEKVNRNAPEIGGAGVGGPHNGGADVGGPTVREKTDEQIERVETETKVIEKMGEAGYDGGSVISPRTARSGRLLRLEETVVRLDETLAPMQGVKDAMARAVVVWREAIAEKYADRVARAGDLMKIREVGVPDQGLLTQALEAELRRAYRSGRMSVKSEFDRLEANPEIADAVAEGEFQTTRDGIEVDLPGEEVVLSDTVGLGYLIALQVEAEVAVAGASPVLAVKAGQELGRLAARRAKRRKLSRPKVNAPGVSIADDVIPDKAVAQIARSTAAAAADRVRVNAVQAVQAIGIGGVAERADIASTVAQNVLSLSPGPDLNQAQADTNTIFGLGRQQEARSLQAGPGEEVMGIYSTMLESETCDACASLDGARFGMDEVDRYATPNPDCAGGDRCNCLCIFLPV